MAGLTHKALFSKLVDTNVINKGDVYAKWTLPYLMADFSATSGTGQVRLERDYQEVGALLTNNLASKLARLLFPATQPFFKINASKMLVDDAQALGTTTSDLQSALARAELDASQRLFINAAYAQLITMLKHLIVTGNVLLYRDSAEKRTTAYGLRSFGIRRDGKGRMLDCVLREFSYVEALDWDIQEVLRTKDRAQYTRPEKQVEIYTRIKRDVSAGSIRYVVTQEVDTTPVGKASEYPEHLCPWIAPTWNLIAGEHYGRGMVEDYAGGFAKLSDMSEAATLYAVEILRVVNLVSSGSGTDIDDLANAETGQFVRGDPNAVNAFESGVAGKLMEVRQDVQEVVSNLAKAFMYQGNTRNAERVTAYELQRDAQEAEYALGGNYSSLAESVQGPLAHILLLEVKPEMLAGYISQDVKLDIQAGIPALGRSSDVQNLLAATQEAAAIVQPLTALDKRMDPARIMDVIMAGRSVDVKLLHKSEKQQLQEADALEQAAKGQQQLTQAMAGADQLSQVQAIQEVSAG